MSKAHYVLARQGFWWSHYPQAVDHGLQAVALLERSQEWWWLGQAYWAVGINYYFMGDFDLALEAEGRAHALGEARGDPRLQTYTDWCSGWILATRGDWEAAIAVCQRSLERSRDAFNTLAATGWLGFAYRAKGDLARAIPLLDQAIQQLVQVGYQTLEGGFRAWLGEALYLNCEYEKACIMATQALQMGRELRSPYTVAYAQRVLGQIAQANGVMSESHAHLSAALDTFTAIQAHFEAGRTHLALAELAHAQGNRDAATAYANNAYALFMALKTPRYVERTQQFASQCGLVLSNADALPPEYRSSESLR